MRKAAALLALALFVGSAHAQSTSLTVDGSQGQLSFLPEALKALHHVQLTVIDGHSHAKQTYFGVPLIELMEKVGAPVPAAVKGKALAEYVVATGSDGYKAVLSLAEIEPGFHPGTVIVADTLDGKVLDAQGGPFKLVVEEDGKPARWVHNLVKLELKQAE